MGTFLIFAVWELLFFFLLFDHTAIAMHMERESIFRSAHGESVTLGWHARTLVWFISRVAIWRSTPPTAKSSSMPFRVSHFHFETHNNWNQVLRSSEIDFKQVAVSRTRNANLSSLILFPIIIPWLFSPTLLFLSPPLHHRYIAWVLPPNCFLCAFLGQFRITIVIRRRSYEIQFIIFNSRALGCDVFQCLSQTHPFGKSTKKRKTEKPNESMNYPGRHRLRLYPETHTSSHASDPSDGCACVCVCRHRLVPVSANYTCFYATFLHILLFGCESRWWWASRQKQVTFSVYMTRAGPAGREEGCWGWRKGMKERKVRALD